MWPCHLVRTCVLTPRIGASIDAAEAWVDIDHPAGRAAAKRAKLHIPQDGFLFDATVGDNVRFARPELTDEQLAVAFT
ncbi:hypothetical protein ACWCO3_10545, partial [Micromonospora sp. NPDC002411]